MNGKRDKHSLIYIDSVLRQIDKNFVIEIESRFRDNGYVCTSNLEDINSESLTPTIAILSQASLQNDYWNTGHFLKVQLIDPNLSLFDSSENNESTYQLSHESEIDDLFVFIELYITRFFEGLRDKLNPIMDSNFKKLMLRKNIEELEKSEYIDALNKFESSLFNITRMKDFFLRLPELSNQNFGVSVEILSLRQVANELDHKSLLPLFVGEEEYYLIWNEDISPEIIMGIYSIIHQYLNRYESLIQNDTLRIDLELLLSLIPEPFVLLKNSEISLYNKAFVELKLSLKDCLETENNSQLTLSQNVYRVLRISTDNDCELISFFGVNKLLSVDEAPSSKELGIVSSSIAHELNNPLAGILAAIEVLSLDDLDNDIMAQLEQMKKGVLRCKKLVETYLGFSRLQVTESSKAVQGDNEQRLANSLEQSMELMRFRLIENNLILQPEHIVNFDFKDNLNPYVLSMLLYLIFGEAVTGFSHHALVSQESQKQLKIIFVENVREFSIQLPIEAKISDKFFESKLIIHLVDRLGLALSWNQGQIIFTSNS